MIADLWVEFLFGAGGFVAFRFLKRDTERSLERRRQEIALAWRQFEDERVDHIDARVEACLFNGV